MNAVARATPHDAPSPAPEVRGDDWYKDAVIYQLHVKSFFDSNNDGIGDFNGLISKLDYIAELGVTAIWLLPFYPSPRRDDGYDIAAYVGVHPDYGTMEDAKRFIDEAHARGLRVITELVINHTSDEHEWFQRARRAPAGSPERAFYVWSDTDQAYDGTRIIFCDTEKSNWTFDPVANAYYWHRFYSHQPDLNFDNPVVLDEVLKVMKYWLDLGVDGLRLDAVPYLIEREGTNNENLPETHGVLKKIRAELDRTFPGRMLLAEANQWPEDTQEYFGDADECHMAFHFPLMPRMYMAIAKEDRFPITDIMRQTPAIPESCQWAIFLRNHDELTLEMVTDSERDYLWEIYAAERRARINLGIRRRLAPLLERDRRRIELMTSLLLSMPGTPVMYYGDEIGMGDNIHLGDRDGVRTPMQWSPDRNGGFSRADPERLVLPAIMDPVFGYNALNVEAQRRDPHSLLNWTRRMVALRNQHRTFGRGTVRFLKPGNRRVLAYLREHDGDVVLCVANLARTPQAVELDLSAHATAVPFEMTGASAFPPIGQLPYLLTLPPYGFYWFQLKPAGSMPTWHKPAPELMPEYATLVLRQALDDVLAEPQRHLLETESLPQYLAKRRWFAAKDEAMGRVTIARVTKLADELMLAEVSVELGDRTEQYLLPLGIAWEDEHPAPLPQQLALARVRRGRRVGLLTDAFALEGFSRAVIEKLESGEALRSSDGEQLVFERVRALPDPIEGAEPGVRWLSAEQTNSSLIVDDRVVLKLLRRVATGTQPEIEIGRVLAQHGYGGTPALVGEIVRVGANGDRATVGVMTAFVRNQGDAWQWTLDHLSRLVDELAVGDAGIGEPIDPMRGYDTIAAAIGRRLGQLHETLANVADDPAFAPEPTSVAEAESIASKVSAQLDRAFAHVERVRESLDPAARADADRLLASRELLATSVRTAAALAVDAPRIRIHGDFHLGQVLLSSGEAWIIDFEGEPARSLEERRRKANPLRDVAGLLRSFDYAAAVAARSPEPAALGSFERRAALLELFREQASQRFLEAYFAARGRATPHAQGLLTLFLVDKAAYEISYEAANRPDWIDVPIRGLARLVDGLAGTHLHARASAPSPSAERRP